MQISDVADISSDMFRRILKRDTRDDENEELDYLRIQFYSFLSVKLIASYMFTESVMP